jgi:CHASE2 domain
MTARSHHWGRFGGAAWVIVIVSLATQLLDRIGFLDHFETAGLDAFNLLRPARDPTDIVVVGILDEDYDAPGLFNATSPLRCDSVRRILKVIAEGRPTVIGVDLDTSAAGFGCLDIPREWPPIVWVQDAIWKPGRRIFAEIAPLGGGGPRRAVDQQGLGVMPQDADGVIRRYYRELPLANGRFGRTFPWAVVKTACTAGCQACCRVTAAADESPREALRLNFAGERFNFAPLSVSYVLRMANAPGWQTNGPLTGKIVLLGGAYRPARDTQVTPVGTMNGVQIMAQAIESELHGGGIRPLNEGLALALDFVSGWILVLIQYRFRDRLALALAISLLVIPLLCLVGSYVAFSTLALWFNFVPVVVSVLIHELYEHAREYQELRARHA